MRKVNYTYKGVDRVALLVTCVEEEEKVLSLLSNEDIVGLDIETMPLPEYANQSWGGLSPHCSRIATIQISTQQSAVDVVFWVANYAPYKATRLMREFLLSAKPVAHHAAFEYMHLKHYGIELDVIHDSMLLFRLWVQSRTAETHTVSVGLASAMEVIFGEALSKDNQTSDWGSNDLSDSQIEYAAKDAYATRILFNAVIEVVSREYPCLLNFYRLNRQAVPSVGDLMYYGVKIDVKAHNKIIEDWNEELDEALKEVRRVIPSGVNLNSTKQMSDWIKNNIEGHEELLHDWEQSEKTGNLLVNKDSLKKVSQLPFVEPLLLYKNLIKRVGTYGKNLHKFINPVTGRAHPQYTQCYTETGRLSSRDFNIQNGPRGKFRSIYVTDEDRMLVGADYNMIEVRVFAEVTRDEVLLDCLREGRNLYLEVASMVFGEDVSKLPEEERDLKRQICKAVLLGRLYLLGPITLIGYVKSFTGKTISLAESEHMVSMVDEYMPDGVRWQSATTKLAKETLIAISSQGKVRKLPKDRYYNMSVNTPIQSDAGALIIRAKTRLRDAYKKHGLDARLYASVHDEIITDCHASVVDEVSRIKKEEMEGAMLDIFPNAPTLNLIKVKTGHSWYDIK